MWWSLGGFVNFFIIRVVSSKVICRFCRFMFRSNCINYFDQGMFRSGWQEVGRVSLLILKKQFGAVRSLLINIRRFFVFLLLVYSSIWTWLQVFTVLGTARYSKGILAQLKTFFGEKFLRERGGWVWDVGIGGGGFGGNRGASIWRVLKFTLFRRFQRISQSMLGTKFWFMMSVSFLVLWSSMGFVTFQVLVRVMWYQQSRVLSMSLYLDSRLRLRFRLVVSLYQSVSSFFLFLQMREIWG